MRRDETTQQQKNATLNNCRIYHSGDSLRKTGDGENKKDIILISDNKRKRKEQN